MQEMIFLASQAAVGIQQFNKKLLWWLIFKSQPRLAYFWFVAV